ncbi:hypothetical protein [Streptomyces sp. BK79]|uniref:hypothetical protein n=1 Tax=Streptomyces sp. BK79 TaxID=3350097 RepID=UPI00376FAE23
MRPAVGVFTACAVALLVGGCSEPPSVCAAENRPASPAVEGTRLPVEIAPRNDPPGDLTGEQIDAALPPEEPRPSLTDKVMRGLMYDTVRMAGAVGDVRPGRCETAVPARGEERSQRCTVTYEGLDVVWEVRFTRIDGGLWTTAEYQVKPVTGVLTARKVYQSAGWNYDELSARRCDRMPELIPVEGVGKPTRYQCQMRVHECVDEKGWRFWWENSSVSVDEDGNVDFVVREPE